MIYLPSPEKDRGGSLNRMINERYSCRNFSSRELNLKQVSNILWVAGGKSKYRRTIPSAGAIYPLEIYLIAGERSLEALEAGIYLYLWKSNALDLKMKGDFRRKLALVSVGQNFIAQAPVSILITAAYERTTSYYGQRGIRYVHMEAGHSCENIHLEAVALGLGTVVVGAFQDREIKELLKLEKDPLAIMPLGYPSKNGY